MRFMIAGIIITVLIAGSGCGKKPSDNGPEECTADQTQIGDECIDRVGPSSCSGFLVENGDVCGDGLPDCGELQVYTVDGCVDVGENRDCGTGGWGGIDTSGDVVFVNAAYTGGDGDGSEDRPFPTIAEGLSSATSGGKVAVAAGTYTENVSVPAGVTLEGRCAEQVTIEGAAGSPAVSIADAAGASVVGVTVSGGDAGIEVSASDDVTLEQLVVTDATGVGIHFASGENGIIGDCGIYGSTYSTDDLDGTGLIVETDASLSTVTSTIFSSNAAAGVNTDSGALAMDLCLFSDNELGGLIASAPTGAIGISASRFSGNGWAGVIANGASAGTVTLQSSVVEETTDVSTASSANGDGIMAVDGAEISITGSVVRLNARFGVIIGGSTGIIGDCGIYGNGTDPRDGSASGGVAALPDPTTSDTAILDITGSTISGNTGGGILTWTTELSIADVGLMDNGARGTGEPEGDGIMAVSGSSLDVWRTLIDGTTGGRLGILVDGDGSTGIIGDCGIYGSGYGGIWYQDNAGGSVSGSVITEVGFAGIGLVRGAGSVADAVQITGSTITDVGPGVGLSESGSVIDWGDGVAVMAGSQATVSGNTVNDVDRAGILFDDSSGTIDDNTIDGGDYGIAVQNLGSSTVDGASTSANSISGTSERSVAEDEGLSTDSSGWTASGF